MTDETAVKVYPFHARFDGMPDLFHVACSQHPEFGFCGPEPEAAQARVEHLSTHETPEVPSATRKHAYRAALLARFNLTQKEDDRD